MSLNIKNEHAHALAHKLADLQGISITQAVIKAMERDLAEIQTRGHRNAEEMLRKLRAISLEASKHFEDGFSSADIDALLYDENGLPK